MLPENFPGRLKSTRLSGYCETSVTNKAKGGCAFSNMQSGVVPFEQCYGAEHLLSFGVFNGIATKVIL